MAIQRDSLQGTLWELGFPERMETEGHPVGARVPRANGDRRAPCGSSGSPIEWRPKGSLWELGFPERMETEGLLAACANASNTAGRPSASIRPAEPGSHKTRSGPIRPAEPASHKVQSAARRPAEPPHLLWEPDLSGEWRRRRPGGAPTLATPPGGLRPPFARRSLAPTKPGRAPFARESRPPTRSSQPPGARPSHPTYSGSLIYRANGAAGTLADLPHQQQPPGGLRPPFTRRSLAPTKPGRAPFARQSRPPTKPGRASHTFRSALHPEMPDAHAGGGEPGEVGAGAGHHQG